MKEIVYTSKAPNPVGPYSQAIIANGTLYVSGQIAINVESGNLIVDNIQAETHQVLKNIGEVLKECKLDYTDILKCTVFVKDMGQYSQINEIYAQYFEESTAPARALVEVSRLPKDVNIEISCIASTK